MINAISPIVPKFGTQIGASDLSLCAKSYIQRPISSGVTHPPWFWGHFSKKMLSMKLSFDQFILTINLFQLDQSFGGYIP